MNDASKRLAEALEKAGLTGLALRARTDEFSDFQSQHTFPKMVLVDELREAGATPLIRRVKGGEFDG